MMLKDNLIKQCTCGNDSKFVKLLVNSIPAVSCDNCGVLHQDLFDWTKEDYCNFYKNDYHKEYQEEKGVITYRDRYEHDCRVADMRLDVYQLPKLSVGLDIGSSNSAFVHRAQSRNIQCLGLEPGENIGDDSVTIRGTLESAHLDLDHFDFVTMHDSIEHMVDVNLSLQKVYSILKQGGQLILDLPDYFNPSGLHHWKKIEHLWFFNQDQFEKILGNNGFKIINTTTPIPGKLVYYTIKI